MRPVRKVTAARPLRAALLVLAAGSGVAPGAEAPGALRVCADPDNLPYSNEQGQGFENRIAQLLAGELQLPLQYTWATQRQGFLRRTLHAGACDVVLGVPVELPGILATRPYYSSSYVFVSLRDRALPLGSWDAPVLRTLRIGLQAVGAGGASTPPATALASRGLGGAIVGFPMWGADGADAPRARIIAAVAGGEIDTAVVWGPQAGYYARAYGERLLLTPAASDPRHATLPFSFSIAIGLRPTASLLRDRIQAILDRRQDTIDTILNAYGVPPAPGAAGGSGPSRQADASQDLTREQ